MSSGNWVATPFRSRWGPSNTGEVCSHVVGPIQYGIKWCWCPDEPRYQNADTMWHTTTNSVCTPVTHQAWCLPGWMHMEPSNSVPTGRTLENWGWKWYMANLPDDSPHYCCMLSGTHNVLVLSGLQRELQVQSALDWPALQLCLSRWSTSCVNTIIHDLCAILSIVLSICTVYMISKRSTLFG